MFNLFKTAAKRYENLDGQSFRHKFQSSPKAALIDVRTAGEFAGGSISGARNLDVTNGQLQAALKGMEKNKEYFVFCRSGNRSGMACELMSEQGFKVYNLSGGIGTWPKN